MSDDTTTTAPAVDLELFHRLEREGSGHAQTRTLRASVVPAVLADAHEGLSRFADLRAALFAAEAAERARFAAWQQECHAEREKHRAQLEVALLGGPEPAPYVEPEWPGHKWPQQFFDRLHRAVEACERRFMAEHLEHLCDVVDHRAGPIESRLEQAKREVSEATAELNPYAAARVALGRFRRGEATDARQGKWGRPGRHDSDQQPPRPGEGAAGNRRAAPPPQHPAGPPMSTADKKPPQGKKKPRAVRDELRRERDARIMRLRLSGSTLAEVAAAVALEAARLDALQLAYYDKAIAGDGAALDRVLRIMERRARLLGLDAVVRIEATLRHAADGEVDAAIAELLDTLGADPRPVLLHEPSPPSPGPPLPREDSGPSGAEPCEQDGAPHVPGDVDPSRVAPATESPEPRPDGTAPWWDLGG